MSDGAEIQIELGDVSYKEVGKKRRPDSDRALAVVEYGQPSGVNLPVFIHEQALRGIEAHAASDLSVELGGALIGGFYRDGDKQFVEIIDFIIANKVEHSAAQITFTHDTWAEIDAEREARAPKAQIVGWYHTHPDLGVFLSEPDIFIQQNFFKEQWQVAMVLDPVRGDRGFFQSWQSALVRLPGFYVIAERSRRKALQAYTNQLELSSRRMRESATVPSIASNSGSAAATVWLFLLTIILFAVIIGEAITGRPLFAPPLPGIEERAIASAKMGDYEEAERLYAQLLLERPKDEVRAHRFKDARLQAEELPDVPITRQQRFIKWFISEVDHIAAKSDYETAEKLYNAAGIKINGMSGEDVPWTKRDQEVLAAYRYLAEQVRFEKGDNKDKGASDDETSLKMPANIKASWDLETVQKMQAGLKYLIAAKSPNSTELKKALKSLEKEYRLRSKGAK